MCQEKLNFVEGDAKMGIIKSTGIAIEVMDFIEKKLENETTEIEVEVLEVMKRMIEDKYEAIMES